MTAKKCFQTRLAGFDITLKQTGVDRFVVRYGAQERAGLSYAKAAQELGECLMYAMACEGRLDNREQA